jgi:hypothetical protein
MMMYTYDLMVQEGPTVRRLETTTSVDEIKAEHCIWPKFVHVTDGVTLVGKQILNPDELEMWKDKLERDGTWRPHKTWDPLDTEETDIVKIANPEDLKRDLAKAYGEGNVKVKMRGNAVESKSAVDPIHYKNYIADLQWVDAMSEIPTLRKPERFIAALEMQIRKYLDRREQKDDDVQEMGKTLAYMAYLYVYMRDGSARMEDIQRWIKQL